MLRMGSITGGGEPDWANMEKKKLRITFVKYSI
jgi:hypothetical protein